MVRCNSAEHADLSVCWPAVCAGPALCATMSGIQLTPHELSALLAPMIVDSVPALASPWGCRMIRGRVLNAAAGLMTAFAITDVLQVRSCIT